MIQHLARRTFLKTASTATAAAGFGVWSSRTARASLSPNEKLNLASIGTAGMAGDNLAKVAHENIVALCDVDEKSLGAAGLKYSAAARYADFRKMLEKERSRIDAVLVSTPDHIHAPASVMAMRLGKHCFCEKPLAWSVNEVRIMAQVAEESQVATQMGINIHAKDNYRRVVEIIQSGVLGPVTEVITWCGKTWGGGERPVKEYAVPANLNWDLWIGPAPMRPFAPGYHPKQWRRWWDFGGGTLGDMACHLVDLPFWALNLTHPSSIHAEGPPPSMETAPLGMTVRWEFAAKGDEPPLTLIWQDGASIPKSLAEHKMPSMGVFFKGKEGQLFANYDSYKLYPNEKFKDFTPPPRTISSSVGHWQEWIDACKTGAPTTCNFKYSAKLSETVLLGNVAFRVGKKIAWDSNIGQAIECPEANLFLGREYRQGWAL